MMSHFKGSHTSERKILLPTYQVYSVVAALMNLMSHTVL